jgi:hypothetical protein
VSLLSFWWRVRVDIIGPAPCYSAGGFSNQVAANQTARGCSTQPRTLAGNRDSINPLLQPLWLPPACCTPPCADPWHSHEQYLPTAADSSTHHMRVCCRLQHCCWQRNTTGTANPPAQHASHPPSPCRNPASHSASPKQPPHKWPCPCPSANAALTPRRDVQRGLLQQLLQGWAAHSASPAAMHASGSAAVAAMASCSIPGATVAVLFVFQELMQ